jgi:hypothetical protein
MKIKWAVGSLLALSLTTSGWMTAKAWSAPLAYGAQEHGWDTPPAEFREVQRKGFHDGVEGARKDFDNHRPPNVNNRDEYRHPHVDPSMRDDYRDGFRRGYDTAMEHLAGH